MELPIQVRDPEGEMNALVVATGMNTYFGATTKLVAEIRTRSHFQKAVLNIGNYLIVLAGCIVAIVLVVEELFRHTPFLETLQFALVLIVAAIPAALPAVMSVSMAVGATELAKKRSYSQQTGLHRRNGRNGHSMFG